MSINSNTFFFSFQLLLNRDFPKKCPEEPSRYYLMQYTITGQENAKANLPFDVCPIKKASLLNGWKY